MEREKTGDGIKKGKKNCLVQERGGGGRGGKEGFTGYKKKEREKENVLG